MGLAFFLSWGLAVAVVLVVGKVAVLGSYFPFFSTNQDEN